MVAWPQALTLEDAILTARRGSVSALEARQDEASAQSNYRVTVQMREVAGERLKLGTVGRDEYLQLELRALNDSIAINENSVKVREAQMELNSLLGYDDAAEIEPVLEENLPDSMLQVPDFFLCLQ